MAAADSEKELEERLREVGGRLNTPPEVIDELLSLLDQIEALLSRVEQSPSKSMMNALRPAMSGLVSNILLGHVDTDVKVSVASCISEITRITAPDAPYDDDLMKDVFRGIVEAFEKLDDMESRSYSKRVSILETVAKVRSCVVMLDLECDDLILHMFCHFLKTITLKHPDDVFTSMETIMTLVIEESEDVSPQLASCLLQSVKKDEKETLPSSFRLAEKVIGNCSEKLKPALVQILQGAPSDEYSNVVTSLCQHNSDAVEDNDVDTSGKDMADDSKLSERTVSDELPQESAKLEQDASCPEEDGTSRNNASRTTMSNGVTPVGDGDPLAGPASPKQKPERSQRGGQGKSNDQSKSGNSDMVEPVATKTEKLSDLNVKKGHKMNSSVKAEPCDRSKVDNDKEAPAVSGTKKPHGKESASAQSAGLSGEKELSGDTKEGQGQPSKTDNGVDEVTSGPVDSTPETVKPKRGRPPVSKTSEKKAVGKTQSSGLDSKKGLDEVSDSEGKSTRRSAKEDGKSSTKKTGQGESRKQQKSSLKQQKEEVLSDEDTAEDLSLKEMVSPKSSTKASGKSKGQLGGSGGSKRKRGQETEEGPESKKNKNLDESLVGSRVKVWWPEDKMFYHGVVDSFDAYTKKHKVSYDDGDEEILLLKKERWEFIDEERENELLGRHEASKTPRSKKARTTLGKSVKEAKTETPKSGKELQSNDGGDLPKRKGRPKAARSKDESLGTASKSKGKAVSEDLDETPKTLSSLKKEGANRSKDNVSKSAGKSKGEVSKGSSHSKDDSAKPGKKFKDGTSRSASKSKDVEGSKDAKDKIKSSEATPNSGRKQKGGGSTPKTGDGSKTNGMSDKGKLKEKGVETSGKGAGGSAKVSTGKKRRRKSQS